MTQSPLHIFKVVKSTAGVGQGARWIVEGLHHRFRFTVACVSEGGAALAADLNTLPGVRAFNLSMQRYGVDPLGDAKLAVQLARIMRREDFDVIHARASKPGFLMRLASIGTGLPAIYQPACFAFHDGVPRPKAALIAGIERIIARYLTTYILCVCDEECDLARRWHVGNESQLVRIYNSVDTTLFDQPADRSALRSGLNVPIDVPLVGTVGRLSQQKAPADFVHAAVQLHAHSPHVHFVWIGSGPLEAETRALVQRKGLQHVFHFAGERRDVPTLLQALDVFVLPSHWEGFSFSVLEAMAARLPVIATRVTGTAEAVADGHSGLLVPIGAPDALAAAIAQLTSDPERARRYGTASRERLEKLFTREHMLNQIAALYESAAAYGATHRRHRSAIFSK